MVFLGQGPAGPIPTARPTLLSLPCTRLASSLGLGLRCPIGKSPREPERQLCLGPYPLTLSRTRQPRIPEHICQSGLWPVGLSRASCLWGGKETRTPSFGRDKRGTDAGQGGGTAPLPAARRSPSRPRYAAAEGAPAGLRLAPKRPNSWRWDSPQAERAPIQGTHKDVPEDHASQLFVRSPPYHRQLY